MQVNPLGNNKVDNLTQRINELSKKITPAVIAKITAGTDGTTKYAIAKELMALIRDAGTMLNECTSAQKKSLMTMGNSFKTAVNTGLNVERGFLARLFDSKSSRAERYTDIRRDVVVVESGLGKLNGTAMKTIGGDIESGRQALVNIVTEMINERGSAKTLNKFEIAIKVNAMLPESLRLPTLGSKDDPKFLIDVATVLRTTLPAELETDELRNLKLFFTHHEFNTFVRTDEGGLFMLMNTPSPHEQSIYQLSVLKGKNSGKQDRLQLGQGSFGVVRWAMMMPQGEMCAVKKISGRNAIENSLQEKAIQSELQGCPHVMTGLGSLTSTAKTKLYLMMPLCRGEELLKKLARIRASSIQPQQKTDLIKYIAKQVFEGISEIHTKGIGHRDIKLENCLIDDLGHVSVIDFGLATKETQSKERVGTPGYMAPEVVGVDRPKGGYNPQHADMFSLGVMLYELNVNKGATDLVTLDEDWNYHGNAFDEVQSRISENITGNDSAKALISNLTKMKGGLRPTAREALENVYFNDPITENVARGILAQL